MKKDYVDHKGNSYRYLRDICNEYDIKCSTFISRLSRGWSLKKALTTKVVHNCNTAKDHLGNTFPSTRSMCMHYNIQPSTFNDHLKRGWSLEKALSFNVLYKNRQLIFDHTGNSFDRIKAMCDYYDVNITTYQRRMRMGWSLEDTLLTPIYQCKKSLQESEFLDHNGNIFTSLTELLSFYNVSNELYSWGRKKGYTLEQCLLGKVNLVYDHLNKPYTSVTEMCKFHSIKRTTFIERRRRGYTLEEALTATVGEYVLPMKKEVHSDEK